MICSPIICVCLFLRYKIHSAFGAFFGIILRGSSIINPLSQCVFSRHFLLFIIMNLANARNEIRRSESFVWFCNLVLNKPQQPQPLAPSIHSTKTFPHSLPDNTAPVAQQYVLHLRLVAGEASG